jgi:hypothetical protein
MGFIKSSHFPRYGECHRMDESAQHALSWMTRPRPGIRWQSPVRAAKDRPGLNLASFQTHHSFLRRNP